MLKTLSNGLEEQWLCIPGVGSFSSSFEAIASFLNGKNIGLVAAEIIDVFKIRSELEDVAGIVNLILEANPNLLLEPTYTILGHSFGGRIAYELGKRRSEKGLESCIVMIDALPKNLSGTQEPEGLPLTDEALLRWYVSTFPPAFRHKFDDVPDADLADALVTSRIFRRDDVAAFTDAMRRQILAHNAYTPLHLASSFVDLTVIVPKDGIFADTDPSLLHSALNETAERWRIQDTTGDHYSILKDAEQIFQFLPNN